MAVTIDEMHVEVQSPAPESAPSPAAEPPKDVDLREAMTLFGERTARLRAD